MTDRAADAEWPHTDPANAGIRTGKGYAVLLVKK